MADGNFSASYGDEETVTGSINFETNGNGYVTKIIADMYSKVSDGSWTKTKSSATFSYDGDGQLTGGSTSGTVEGYNEEYGGNYSETGSGWGTYTWNGGNLVQIVGESTETMKMNGMSVDCITKESASFTYGSEQNPLRQNPVWDKGVEDLDLIGVFGVGPVNLPASSKSEYTEYVGSELESESAYETTYTFTLNSNGTIDTQMDKKKHTKSSHTVPLAAPVLPLTTLAMTPNRRARQPLPTSDNSATSCVPSTRDFSSRIGKRQRSKAYTQITKQ